MSSYFGFTPSTQRLLKQYGCIIPLCYSYANAIILSKLTKHCDHTTATGFNWGGYDKGLASYPMMPYYPIF